MASLSLCELGRSGAFTRWDKSANILELNNETSSKTAWIVSDLVKKNNDRFLGKIGNNVDVDIRTYQNIERYNEELTKFSFVKKISTGVFQGKNAIVIYKDQGDLQDRSKYQGYNVFETRSKAHSPVICKVCASREDYNRALSSMTEFLRSPYIVRHRKGDRKYFLLEMNKAGDLDLHSHALNKLEVADIQLIAEQILRALVIMHGKGIVHLDVKNKNVCITGRTQVELIDLDFSTKVGEITHIIGTFGFANPRRFFYLPADPADDLFPIGISMFEAYTDMLLLAHFNDSEKQEIVIANLQKSLNEDELAVFNEKDQILLAKILICMHEYERAFGRIPESVILSFLQYCKYFPYCRFDFIFEYDESNQYKLRDLGFELLPEFDWKEEVRAAGVDKGEDKSDVEDLIAMIEKLCSYRQDMQAIDYLQLPFFSHSIKFKMKIDRYYFKKSYELVVKDPSNELNFIVIDLNKNPRHVANKIFHLLPNKENRFDVEIRSQTRPDNKVLEIKGLCIKDGKSINVKY